MGRPRLRAQLGAARAGVARARNQGLYANGRALVLHDPPGTGTGTGTFTGTVENEARHDQPAYGGLIVVDAEKDSLAKGAM